MKKSTIALILFIVLTILGCNHNEPAGFIDIKENQIVVSNSIKPSLIYFYWKDNTLKEQEKVVEMKNSELKFTEILTRDSLDINQILKKSTLFSITVITDNGIKYNTSFMPDTLKETKIYLFLKEE